MSFQFVVVWTFLAPVVAVRWLVGPFDATTFVLTAAFALLGFPWLLARTFAIPLGWVRPAWVLGRLAEVVWRQDRAGGAALAAAWALARRREHLKLAVWVELRLESLAPLSGAGVLAAGVAASLRGDAAGARRLIESVALVGPTAATRLANEWLAGDSASRGEWADVKERAAVAPTRMTRLLGLVAERMLGAEIPEWRLRLAWWLAPHRRATRPLLALAPTAPSAPPEARAPAPASHPYRDLPRDDRLRAALAAHLAVASAPELPAGRLAETVARWDETLADDDTRRFVEERARVVGARATSALAAVTATVEEELAELALSRGEPVVEAGPVATAAARRLRQRLLGDVEKAARSLTSRVAAGRELPAIHEWRETMALRDLVARGGRLGGLPLRRLVFEDVHTALCPLACRLWNERRQRLAADAIFRYLLAEAEAVGHSRLAEHERRNVRHTG